MKKEAVFVCQRFIRLVFGLMIFVPLMSSGAPYGPEGKAAVYRQPDGSTVQLRVFGDEFYAVAETLDGYTVTKDLKTGQFCYAKFAPNGKGFISTGIAVGKGNPPAGINKGIRLTPAARSELSMRRRDLLGVDSRGRLKAELAAKLRPRDFGYKKYSPAVEREIKRNGYKPRNPNAAPLASKDSNEDVSIEDISTILKTDSGEGGATEEPPPLPAPPSSPTVDNRIGLVLLASFPDRQSDIVFSQAQVDNYFNDPNYTEFGNATSVYGYFSVQSNGKLSYNCIVTAYFTAANNRDYYVTNQGVSFGVQARWLINEGIDKLAAEGFDFAQCDANGDGVIDGINCFYAGDNVNTWDDDFGLWPHKSSSSNANLTDGGLTSSSYQYQITDMTLTDLRIGTVCHENGHMLCNFPDLYAYNSASGGAAKIDDFSLMASGNYGGSRFHPTNVDPYLKNAAGWATIVEVDNTSSLRALLDVDNNTFYRFRNPSNSKEYFIMELRDNTGYEGPYGGHLSSVNPTTGLVIYHANEDGLNTYGSIATGADPVDYSTPYELLILEDDRAAASPWYTDPSPSSGDAFESGDTIDDTTTPSAKFWSSSGRTVASGMWIHEISTPADTVTFVIGDTPTGSPEISTSETAFSPTCDLGTDAATQSFSINNSGSGTLNYIISDNQTWLSVDVPSGSATTESDSVNITYDTSGLGSGTYSATITIEDANASNSPYTISISLTVNDQPTIAVSPLSISELGTAGVSGPETEFTIRNTGGGLMNYTLNKAENWLNFSQATGMVQTEVDTIYVTLDATSLAGGIHSNTITITSAESSNTPIEIPVVFTVQSTEMIVTAPNGGESWYAGMTKAITWNSSLGGTVKIELYKGGSLDSTIIASTANDGSYDWSIPGGLTAGTDYTVKITSNEQTSKNDISNADFEIATGLVFLPYTQDFESGLGTMTQSYVGGTLDWRTQNGGSSGGSNPSSAHGGTANAILQESTWDGSSTRLITPVFDSTGLTNLTVNFWHAQVDWQGDQDTLKVYYSTNEGTDWTLITGADYTASIATWTERNLSIPSSANRIAFVGACNYGYGVCVDDILISGEQAGPNVSVEATDPTASEEGQETGTWTITNSGDNSSDVTVNFTLSGTATGGGTDYTVSAASSVTILSGETTATVTLTPEDDSVISEGDETARLTIETDTGYTIGSPSFADITITDNDAPGELSISQSSYSVAEDGSTVRIYVTRNIGSTGAVSVDYTTIDGTGVAGTDYTTTSGTLNWGDGSMVTNYFDVTITDNTLYTGDRAFAVRLSNPVGGVGLALTNATVTILEDEVLPSVPLGLVATPSIGQVDLVWGAASEATGYKVKRATSPGGPFDTTLGTSATTNYSDSTASDGTIYYYVVAATNPAGESTNSSVASATLPNVVPFVEDFEAPVSAGDLAGQRLWVASNAVVEAGVGVSGSQGLNLGTGTAQQTFSNGSNTVTVSVYCKPVPGEEPASVAPDAASVFWVDTNLYVRAYSNTTVVTLPAQIDTNTWTQFEVTVDYDAGTWQLSVDGGAAIAGLGLYSARTNFTTLLFENTTEKAFYIDDISIASAAASPTDYELWLDNYFSGIDVENTMIVSNGINTVREAYVAGLDPTNAASVFAVTSIGNESGAIISWGGVSGRLYNVYWSSNLLEGASGFDLLYSNVPWNASSVTDTVHSAKNSGFYRIDVQLDE